MKKLLLALLLPFFVFLSSPNKASADAKFATDYSVAYGVSQDSTTKVTLTISLKNKTTQYFASSYDVETGFKNVKNIKVTDLGGNVNFLSSEDDNGTKISFKFNKKVVGINNAQKFSVSFDTNEISKHLGNVWEVNVPGISNQSQYEQFNASVTVPNELGNPSIIKPNVENLKQTGNTLFFTKNQLGKSGISITYGDNQIYNFDLMYHIYNKNLFPVNTEIALPSNNNYQEVALDDIFPKPLDVYQDPDGNWLATYSLSSSQKMEINVKGSARVYYAPKTSGITQEQRKQYLSKTNYWQVNDSKIKSLATQLKTPEAIYRYVVENLKYDSSRVTDNQVRAGAIQALENKNSAVCLEFTDLFITLARSAGIPARMVEGYANTDNSAKRPASLLKDVLHAWPEYYDDKKKEWIMVDPTWENTTGGIDYFNVFDLDHLSFVINGKDSAYPIPAGGYKFPRQLDTKDVNITTSSVFKPQNSVLSATADFDNSYLSGRPIEGRITILNLSGVVAPNQNLKVTTDFLNPQSQYLYFDSIPPFGKKHLTVKFSSVSFLTNQSDTIKITIGSETLEKGITISPFYRHRNLVIGGIIIGIFASIIIWGVARKSRNLHVS